MGVAYIAAEFVCKNCGCISKNVEVEFDGEAKSKYIRLADAAEDALTQFMETHGHWAEFDLKIKLAHLDYKYNYIIICPVCNGLTKFWKE